MTDDPRPTRKGGTPLSGGEFAGIGLQFGISVVVWTFVGRWLDRRLGTTPWLLILCVFLGGFASFYVMYRTVKAAQQRDAESRRPPGGGGSR